MNGIAVRVDCMQSVELHVCSGILHVTRHFAWHVTSKQLLLYTCCKPCYNAFYTTYNVPREISQKSNFEKSYIEKSANEIPSYVICLLLYPKHPQTLIPDTALF